MKLNLVIAAVAGVLLSGCAATLQSNDDLQAATAMSLGLQASDVTISNRADSGNGTNYWVKTKDGRTYSCLRTAAPGMFGTVTSSPLCNPTNTRAEAAPQPSNALLDANRQQQATQIQRAAEPPQPASAKPTQPAAAKPAQPQKKK